MLCQVLYHATIAAEAGWFTLADVAGGLADKLVRRHPHVFGEDAASIDAEDVASGLGRRPSRRRRAATSLLDGIPPALPALALAAKLERRARDEVAARRSDERRSRG